MRHLRELGWVAALIAALAFAPSAQAQNGGAAGLLDAPGGQRGASTVEVPAQTEPGSTELEIPAPPGAAHPDEDELRYPIPTPPEVAARSQAAEPSIRIPSRITTRLRALDANLRSLAARGGGNVVNAVLSLLTGGLSITLGALKEPNDDAMSIYLYVYGGTAAARGVLDLVLTPNAEGSAITYQHMPMTSSDEVRARLAYGEAALAGLAEQSLIARVLDASLNMAAGIAVVPIYLAPNNFEIVDPLDYFILIGAGVSVISGIITLVSSSAAEQRWSAYQELRQRLQSERAAERRGATARGAEPLPLDEDEDELALPSTSDPSWQMGFSPMPDGAFAGFSLRL